MIRTGDGSNWNKKKKNSLKIIEKNILIVHSFNEQLVSCDLNSTCTIQFVPLPWLKIVESWSDLLSADNEIVPKQAPLRQGNHIRHKEVKRE